MANYLPVIPIAEIVLSNQGFYRHNFQLCSPRSSPPKPLTVPHHAFTRSSCVIRRRYRPLQTRLPRISRPVFIPSGWRGLLSLLRLSSPIPLTTRRLPRRSSPLHFFQNNPLFAPKSLCSPAKLKGCYPTLSDPCLSLRIMFRLPVPHTVRLSTTTPSMHVHHRHP